jgi:hypothetical protein
MKEEDIIEICIKAWLKFTKEFIIESFKELKYLIEVDYDYSPERENIIN